MAETKPGGIVNHPWIVLFLLPATPAALTGLREPSDFGCHISDGARAKADVLAIGMAVEEYAMNNRRKYPATLDDLIRPDVQGYRYLDETRLPRDPWNREYVNVPGTPPNVLTYGRDGVMGGAGEDADVDHGAVAGGR